MTAFETLGFFYCILAVATFTAGLLMAATLGVKLVFRTYRKGESTVRDPLERMFR